MNKNAIKKFAIEARTKLIASVTDKAGMLGITEKSCSEPITKGADFEVYQTTAGTEVTLNKRQCEQRRRLVSQIESRGFEAVVEEVAYTWFNRICAIRFMEVNDYLPNRVRVLSSEKEGKMEPDLVTQAPDVDLDLTTQEKEEIINWKLSGTSEDTDKLYCKLFLKQCHQLHDILPGLFEADSDYMELLFGISYTNKDDVIYMLVNPKTGIPENDFNVSALDEEGNPTGQVEIIGWMYQYYNTELKDDTFAKLKKNVKITKERIPAATQLFTPDWIVRYMVENSVGRIWIEHLRAVDSTTDEKATAERFGWKYYLPEAEQEEEVNVKLAEIRSTYKVLKPTDITCIDPCMGSGHILIAMFDVLMDIYESAGYDKREAAFEIVEHNIHGLDIDQRAYQLAYFAVMMKGRGYNRRFLRGRDGKPEPKVYAITESNEINRKHLKFFGAHLSDMERNLAVIQMEGLLDTFMDAREYGSILNVDACDWDVLEKFVEDLGTAGQISFESVGSEETQENLRKLVRVAKNLGQKYDAVVTNPPYMGSRGGMNSKLYKFVNDNYADSKADLYSVFIEKCGHMLAPKGLQAMITQQGWLFLTSFTKLREKVLSMDIINLLHLGARAFDEIGGEVVQSTAFVLRKSNQKNYLATYSRLLEGKSEKEKETAFFDYNNRFYLNKEKYDALSEKSIAYWLSKSMFDVFDNMELGKIAKPRQGMATSDNNRFLRLWNEVDWNKVELCADNEEQAILSSKKWFPYNKGGGFRKWYGNNDYLINWENNGQEVKKLATDLYKCVTRTIKNMQFYFQEGLTWSTLSSGTFNARYTNKGFLFDTKGSTCFFEKREQLPYVASFLNSIVANELLKILAPTLDYNAGAIAKLPIIFSNEYKVEINRLYEKCLYFAKIDWDSFETSWDFKCHPLISVINRNPALAENTDAINLAECYTCWEKECDERFYLLKTSEENLNRIFIDIYGLNGELVPEVEDNNITVRKADLQREIKSLISYAVGCMFGRYSLDEEGLIYAGGVWEESRYITFQPDEDNIIPITDEEYFEDEIVSRFCDWLEKVFGTKTFDINMGFIAKVLGNKGDTSREVVRNYFLNDFFKDHCNTYCITGSGKRPIYWLFDSGKQNGFKALIYMHRYDADTVGRVRTDYLHRAQKYVETAMQSAQYTIDNASSASEKSNATKAVTKYTKQLAEMKIYDEAIAHIANKRIEIDLDDGVKVNYAKFQGVEVAQEGKKTLKVDLLAKIK